MNDQDPNRDPEGEGGGNPWVKSLLVWGGIFLALLLVVSMFSADTTPAGTAIGYSEFRNKVVEGTVAEVQVAPDKITGKLKNNEAFTTIPVANDTGLPKLLEDNGVNYTGTAPDEPNVLMYILIKSLPFLLILGVAYLRPAPGAEGRRIGRDGLRQVQGQAADRAPGPGDLRRRRRHRRSARGAARKSSSS